MRPQPLVRAVSMQAALNRAGAAAVEFALLAPFLFAIVMATIELGRAMEVNEDLTAGARAGARSAISLSQGASGNTSTIANAVTSALQLEDIPAPSTTADSNSVETLVIEIAGPEPTGAPSDWSSWTPTWDTYSDAAPPASGYLVRVTVKAQANKVTWLPMGGWFLGSTFYFQSVVVMRVP